MYADDTNLTFASKDPNELFSSLTHDFGNLKQSLDSNRLSLNVLKTKCLFTGTRQKISLLPSDPHISLDGHSIERVNSYKCLGVQVDETLSWEAHISEVIGKVAKVLAALRMLRPICPQSTFVTIDKSLILPHLDYCRHNLRGAQHNLFIPRLNTEALKKSFRYRGAVTWNSLSAEAKQATTLNCFYSAIVH